MYTESSWKRLFHAQPIVKLELVYLPKGKYCVYPRMVYRLAIVTPPPPPPAISDQYATLIFWFFFTKWLPAAILDDRKSLSIAFLAISDQYATFIFFHKMARSGHFGLTVNHFWSHFSPFQINTQLLFFHKMAASHHFGWQKIAFGRISYHFRSIPNFYLFWFFFTNWPPFWMTENHFRMYFSPF